MRTRPWLWIAAKSSAVLKRLPHQLQRDPDRADPHRPSPYIAEMFLPMRRQSTAPAAGEMDQARLLPRRRRAGIAAYGKGDVRMGPFDGAFGHRQIGRASCMERGCQYV